MGTYVIYAIYYWAAAAGTAVATVIGSIISLNIYYQVKLKINVFKLYLKILHGTMLCIGAACVAGLLLNYLIAPTGWLYFALKAVATSHGKIVRHGMVGPDEIADVYAEADVLVSVGNSLPEFKPSKTFEYIATCKPILNIYYNGLRDDVLENYPMSLQICNSAEATLCAKEIDEFISISAGKMVLEDEIKTRFKKYMPDSIQTIMTNALRG